MQVAAAQVKASPSQLRGESSSGPVPPPPFQAMAHTPNDTTQLLMQPLTREKLR